MTHTTLSKTLDKIAYDTILQTQPQAIEDIRHLLELAGTAKQLEARLQRTYGRGSVAVALFIGAAYWLEAQRKQNQPAA